MKTLEHDGIHVTHTETYDHASYGPFAAYYHRQRRDCTYFTRIDGKPHMCITQDDFVRACEIIQSTEAYDLAWAPAT